MSAISLIPLTLFFVAHLTFMSKRNFIPQVGFSLLLCAALYTLQLTMGPGLSENIILLVVSTIFLLVPLSLSTATLNREAIITVYSAILLSPTIKFALALFALGVTLTIAIHLARNRGASRLRDIRGGLDAAHLFFLTRGENNFLDSGNEGKKKGLPLATTFLPAFIVSSVVYALTGVL